jgi:ketosteroid isomerase-like protein
MSDSVLAPLKRLVIERACEQLSIDYARAVDFGDYARFVDLFTDDAVLDLGMRLEGKEAIRSSMQTRGRDIRTRHVLTNIFVEVHDAAHARGTAYLTLYRHVGVDSSKPAPIPSTQPTAIGHYEDEFVLTTAGWRFKSRTLRVAFRDPNTVKPQSADLAHAKAARRS